MKTKWIALTLICQTGLLVSGTWHWGSFDPVKDWDVPSNWIEHLGYPNGVDDIALLELALTNNQLIHLSIPQNITVGSVTLDSNKDFTIDFSPNQLIFESSSDPAHLTVTNAIGNGAHTIACPILLKTDLKIDQASTNPLTLSGNITNLVNHGLSKFGSGTLILSGVNSYGGGTTLDEGAISLQNNNSMSNGTLSMAGSTTVIFANGITVPNNVHLFGIGTFQVPTGSATATGTFTDAPVPGLLGLVKTGGGELVLTNLTSYSGPTTLQEGTLTLQEPNTGIGPGLLTLGNGTTLTIDTTGTITLSGSISGGGAIVSGPTGTLIFSAPTTYTGDTTIFGGELTLEGTNAGLGSGLLTLALGTALNVNSTNTVTMSGPITGDGAVTKTGVGTLIFSNTTNYTGATTIEGSLFLEGANTGLGPGLLTLQPDSTLRVNSANTVTLIGAITGSGDLIKAGIGTLVLDNTNSYTQGTTLDGGALSLQTSGSMSNGTLSMAGNTTVIFANGITVPNNVHLFGIGTFQVPTGSATATGAFTEALVPGPRGLIKTGGGELILTNVTTYSGPTTLQEGTLTLQGANTGMGPGSFTIKSGTTLKTNSAGTITLSGPLLEGGNISVEAGTLSLTGAGTQLDAGTLSLALGATLNIDTGGTTVLNTLTGQGSLINTNGTTRCPQNNSGFTGSTQVNGGIFNVNGSLANSSFTIAPGATLTGTGTVGTTTNSGTIRPGNSIGTLTFNGPLTLNPSSNIPIEISPTANSKLIVNGAANLNGSLTVVPNPGFYGFSECYTILTSTNLAGTTFSSVSSTNSAFMPTLTYPGADVQLCIALDDPFVFFPFANANVQAVAENLVELFSQGELPPGLLAIVDTLKGQSDAVINAALDEMHPAPLSALTEMQVEIDSSLLTLFHRQPYLGCYCDKSNRFWIEPFGNLFSLKKRGMQIGARATTGGVALGFDKLVTDHLSLGLGGAWNESHLHWKHQRGHANVEGFYIGPYADFANNGIYVGASFLVGADFYRTNRHIQFLTTDAHAKARYKALDLMGQFTASYQIGKQRASFIPYGKLNFFYLGEQKFAEFGAGDLDLSVHSRVDTTFRTELGASFQIKASDMFDRICFLPQLSIAWVNLLPLQRGTFTSIFDTAPISFATHGWDHTWNLLHADAKLNFSYRCFSWNLDYTFEFAPNTNHSYLNQNASAALSWKW